MDLIQIVVVALLVVMVTISVVRFARDVKDNKVTAKDIEDLKQWLMYAVTIAQKEFGKDTGELKLYKVWDMATDKFPWITSLVSFETFREWVDDAKEKVIELSKDNEAIADFINGIINKELNDGE